MATANEVLTLFDEWNSVIQQLNDSDSIVVSQVIADDATTASANGNWGNGTKYVNRVNEVFTRLSTSIGTNHVKPDVSALNEAITAYRTYLETSWWQFGSGARPQTMSLPAVTELGE